MYLAVNIRPLLVNLATQYSYSTKRIELNSILNLNRAIDSKTMWFFKKNLKFSKFFQKFKYANKENQFQFEAISSISL